MSTARPLRALLLIGLISLGACRGPKAPETTPAAPPAKADAAWSQHLAEHSAGAVSRHAPISLRFSHDVVAASAVGSPAPQLKITPTPSGSARFAGPREIVWTPTEPLKAGQEYQATLSPQGLLAVPDTLAAYPFAFRPVAPDFEISEASLSPDPAQRDRLQLVGRLDTADGEQAEVVRQLVRATLGDAALPLSWSHLNNNRAHQFTVQGITRGSADQLLRVSWQGKPLGVEREGVRELSVPRQGVFAVLDASVVDAGQQTIRVRLTDTLDKTQKLPPLVRLSRGSSTVRVDGSDLMIYPTEHLTGEVTLALEPGLKSSRGAKLGKPFETTLSFVNQRPQVRFSGPGNILPAGPALSLPFEALNARQVQVTAFQIYENDIGQFLQTNTLDGDTELHRVGRYLWRKTLTLPPGQPNRWNRHALDVGELLRAEPGALFRITLSLSRADATLACPGAPPAPGAEPLANHEDLDLTESSGWDGIDSYYQTGEDPQWSERDDPCKDAYYRYAEGVRVERNLLASNIGLMAKRGADGVLHLAAASIDGAEPLAGVELEVRNFQNQPIGKGSTGSDGLATLTPSGTPFYLVARQGREVGYLKLSKGTALANSHFDVGGDTVEAGLKGLIYGERGVWRPGDALHLTFLLQDDSGKLPANHPVTLQLFNPANQLVTTATNNTPMDGFYRFTLTTDNDAPTGLWRAKVLVGGREFSKNLPIETVVPNRLKMALGFNKPLAQSDMPVTGQLNAEWLHGARAANLKADVAVRLLPRPLAITSFKDYLFTDPTREFTSEPVTLFEGKLDAEGKAEFSARIESESRPPAMLEASFTSRVFEEGGSFSTARSSEPYHLYPRYVGLKLPKGDAVRGMLLTDQKHTVELATVDPTGKPVDVESLQLSVHKIEWKWWWEKDSGSLNADFAASEAQQRIAEGVSITRAGRGQWQFEIKYPDWGRYLVRACDPEGGHCTGKIFYADWPGWAGRAVEQNGPGATALHFFADQPSYRVGETATVQLPDAAVGRALLSLETGSRVLEKRWVQLTAGKTKLEIPITAAMAPSVYVHLTLIQPHRTLTQGNAASKDNDRPIRLYGVIPLAVVNPATVLKPTIQSDAVWRPNGPVQLTVGEQSGRAMTYTVAVVDEGLLGLTSYQTPDAHAEFYRREALGVSTWDLYDAVVGAYGAALERLLSLGGDAGAANPEAEQQKRFPPVVRVLGPFRLEAQKTATHTVELPQYLGAVRVMVIAGRDKAYGHAEKTVVVREPLSVLATAPRVIGPEETLRLPVSAFAFESSVKNVTLTVKADAQHLETVGAASQSLRFEQPGEQSVAFVLKAKALTGTARITVLAESGPHRSQTVINLPVLARNPPLAQERQQVLAPGEAWRPTLTPVGLAGTNSTVLTVSAVPPFGLERRLDMLVHYPHGCAEQLTSAAFPQLYLDRLLPLEPARQQAVQRHVEAAIQRLRVYLAPTGGFAYWPAAGEGALYNAWADNYAGHFLAEAKARGYYVPAELWDAWLARQRKAAAEGARSEDAEVRAYRLYTLTLADKADIGAMNRLAEEPLTAPVARWLLAASYAQVGLPKVAREVLAKGDGSLQPLPAGNPGAQFRSVVRDRAILLQLFTQLGERDKANAEALLIAGALASEDWLSTQSAAWGLLALARHYGAEQGAGFSYQLAVGSGKAQAITATKPLHSQSLPALAEGGALALTNRSDRPLTVSLLQRGSPAAGLETAESQGLTLAVEYFSLKGVRLDESRLPQGVDVVVRLTAANRSGSTLNDLALTQVLPAGWQLHNPRLVAGEATPPALDYQDVRDDRVMTYFGLKDGESRQFEVLINASFIGRYYLPAIQLEAMYDARRRAHTAGRWVEVVPR